MYSIYALDQPLGPGATVTLTADIGHQTRGFRDGNELPELETIDEERRLFYVALTRAKDWLHVYFPLRYYHRRHGRGDAHSYAQLTRFISPKVKALFESQVIYDEDKALELSSAAPAHVGVDALLNELWAD